ncbi:RMV1 [Symbiodinium pilosum]|uniref:RMV1 protein n=1 Tax=Symbiodinium pilosum TaxID=2952 RepID=A0A812QY00_SYMPI|nr:RMV1 [Symbiodinium pilosum]
MQQHRLSFAVGASYGSAEGHAPAAPMTLAEERGTGWIFPLEPLWMLRYGTPSLYELVPRHLRVIQSLPHLVLLVGTATNVFLIVRVVEDYTHWRNRENAYLAVLAASGLFSLYCLWQLMREMAQYRYDLQQRSAQIQALKDDVARRFQLLANELEELLARSADTEIGLAERSLDAERRDLCRFLKNISPKLEKEQSPPFLKHFRHFLLIWLQMLAECAADPVRQPYSVIGEVEFNSCETACELATRVGDRLKAREVRFIRDRTEEGKKGVVSLKTAWKKMTVLQRKALKWTGLQRFVKTQPDEEEGKLPKAEVSCELPQRTEPTPTELWWFKFGFGAGCGFDSNDGSYPLRIRCMVFICIILSPEHLSYMLSLFAGVGLLVLNTFAISNPSHVVIASIAVTGCCVAFVLYDFLDIDTLQRLEEQILEMQAAAQQVEDRRRMLQVFFTRMQLLLSLWQMRTLPRLALMKQLGTALEDEQGAILPLLAEAASNLDALESTLLPLHMWQDDGKLSIEDKEEVFTLIQSLATEANAKDMLLKMPDGVAGQTERQRGRESSP